MEFLGKTFGSYRIDRLLGAVYQAYDLSLQRDVAIKLTHPHLARQPAFRERFIQKMHLASFHWRPNIRGVFYPKAIMQTASSRDRQCCK